MTRAVCSDAAVAELFLRSITVTQRTLLPACLQGCSRWTVLREVPGTSLFSSHVLFFFSPKRVSRSWGWAPRTAWEGAAPLGAVPPALCGHWQGTARQSHLLVTVPSITWENNRAAHDQPGLNIKKWPPKLPHLHVISVHARLSQPNTRVSPPIAMGREEHLQRQGRKFPSKGKILQCSQGWLGQNTTVIGNNNR